jgi:hypothetical protein
MRMKEKVRLYVSRLLSPKENMALFLCRTPLCLYNKYEILIFHIVEKHIVFSVQILFWLVCHCSIFIADIILVSLFVNNSSSNFLLTLFKSLF